MVLALKIRAVFEIFRHFRNPWFVIFARFGLLRLPVFPYRIRKNGHEVTMLARPAAVSMGDLFVLRELFIEETYSALLPLTGNQPLHVLDIGANLGSFVIWLSRHRRVARAFCFEPNPMSFHLCALNLFANGCTSAVPIPKAVGGVAREIQLHGDESRPGGISIFAAEEGNGKSMATVEVVSFEEWLKTVPGDFDVLKVDCEGAEWEMIEHTTPETFARFRIVVAEVHGDPAGKRAPAEFARLFEERGFRTVRWDGHAHGVYLGVRGQDR